ncbi:MAG: rhomboid family intramembrane serine protease [Anaerolineae bacterium]|nr:rhomboid family intramembrane serine protease [Anaerolineae bacterium]
MDILFLFWLLQILSFVFLLPIKDDRGRFRSFPAMTIGIVLLNTLVHVFVYYILPELVDENTQLDILFQMLLVPIDIVNGEGLGALSMITSAFLHSSWMHLIGNMLILFFFSRKLEDVLGPLKFGLFYLTCVFVSSIGSVVAELALPATQGTIPSLGASGAVMGVVAAYLFLYPTQRIRTLPLIGIFPVPLLIPMPAWAFILYTVAHDIVGGLLEQELQVYGYTTLVGWFAHLGGVIAGLTCLYLFLPAEIIHYRRQIGEEV